MKMMLLVLSVVDIPFMKIYMLSQKSRKLFYFPYFEVGILVALKFPEQDANHGQTWHGSFKISVFLGLVIIS